MEILDLSQFTKRKKYRNVHDLHPRWPFRLLSIGSSGCGKTTMILNLIIQGLDYDTFYLYAKDTQEGLYADLLIPFMEARKAKDPTFYFEIHNTLEHLEAIDLDREKQNLVLFDDFINEMKQTNIVDLFTKSRKANASIIYLTQDYHRTPKTIRLNCNYFAIFEINSNREYRNICDAHANKVSYDVFKQAYLDATKKKFDFLLVDCCTSDMSLHLRKNFNHLFNNDT